MLISFLKLYLFSLLIIFLTFNFAIAEEDTLEIEIDNPKFSEKGLDDKTYEIKAEKGLKSDVQLKLFTVEGKFKSSSEGRWIYMEADQGDYNQSSSFIELKKNIKFYTNEGEVLKSNFATFDMANDIIILKENISHNINEVLVIADNSTISQNFNIFKYEGNVSTVLIIRD